MFYAFSKILGDAADSGGLLLLLSLAGVVILFWRRHARLGPVLVAIGVGGLATIAILPVGTWLMQPLENRFAPVRDLPKQVDGIIVLGGAIDLGESAERRTVTLNIRAERMTVFVALARRYPKAALLFSGGNPRLFSSGLTEAQVARQYFVEMGIDPHRMSFENASRNTHENALFSRRMTRVVPGQHWLLVTSAADIPRAVGSFRTVGWDVIPFPADYHTGKSWFTFFPGLVNGLQKTDWAMHEWIGLLYYRLLGWTPALFPRPSG
jgi:uncharacterized SAM-binding protein YcdF (DUF218 family)